VAKVQAASPSLLALTDEVIRMTGSLHVSYGSRAAVRHHIRALPQHLSKQTFDDKTGMPLSCHKRL
jgi:hypothetical protein